MIKQTNLYSPLRLGLLVLQKKNNKCFFYPAICSASRGGLEAFLHFTDGWPKVGGQTTCSEGGSMSIPNAGLDTRGVDWTLHGHIHHCRGVLLETTFPKASLWREILVSKKMKLWLPSNRTPCQLFFEIIMNLKRALGFSKFPFNVHWQNEYNTSTN